MLGWLVDPGGEFFQRAEGDSGYPVSFVDRYLLPVLYPMELGIQNQWMLGLLLLAFNITIYGLVFRRWCRLRSAGV